MSQPRRCRTPICLATAAAAAGSLGGGIAGVVGLALTFIGMAASPRPALLAYLIAYVFWLGLAIGAVVAGDGEPRQRRALERHRPPARRETAGATIAALHRALHPPAAGREAPLALGRAGRISRRSCSSSLEPQAAVPEPGLLHRPRRRVLRLLDRSSPGCCAPGRSRQDETPRCRLTAQRPLVVAAGAAALRAHLQLRLLRLADVAAAHLVLDASSALYIYAGAFVASLALLCLVMTGVRSSDVAVGGADLRRSPAQPRASCCSPSSPSGRTWRSPSTC